jgi:hypothetical protein
MIYLKTYAYSLHELPFLKLNLLESYDHIDKMIICEFNRSHSGVECRNDLLEEHIMKWDQKLLDKILYFKCDISEHTVNINDDGVLDNSTHTINEPIMRSYFTKCVDIQPDDIIVSVDADEIIYGEIYPELIELVRRKGIVKLRLNQFFYKINYHWVNANFIAPCICVAKFIKPNYPHNYRDTGFLFSKHVGCHFSWIMPIECMLRKFFLYSHPEYKRFADRTILENAIQNRTYPFDPKRLFNIKIIELNNKLLPKQLHSMLDEFKDMIYTD